MRASAYVGDVDGKPAAYCTPCLQVVRERALPAPAAPRWRWRLAHG
jgi:predicted Zn-dependent protease